MRRKGVGAVVVGAVLLIAAVAGFIIVPEHAPQFVCGGFGGEVTGNQCAGWSRSAYSTRHGSRHGRSWIVGALLVVMGLIRYARPEVGR